VIGSPPLSLRLRRWRYRTETAGNALGKCWRHPLPSRSTRWEQGSFLVCDAEMSSLDVAGGELLSIGWVTVERGAVALSSARHYLFKADKTVGQSAAIHQLRDCELRGGLPASVVLSELLSAAAGKVLVFHNAALDLAYLNRSCCQEFGAPVLLPNVDTMALEQARLTRRDQVIKSGDLRLQACRKRYNLPSYPGHNALVDALATAELLIAQARHRGAGSSLMLGEFF
jgi:DNA polymerase-3 subunit epsilon